MFGKDDQNVAMRQTSLLKLNHIRVGNYFPKELAMDQILHQLILLELEHSGNQIMSVLSFLTPS